MRLQEKTALVTGATSGIGQVIAEAFAHEGAQVAIPGWNEQWGKQVGEMYGLVDIVVNNGGIFPLSPTAQVNEATFDRVITTELMGVAIFLESSYVHGATLPRDGGASAV